MPTRQQLDIDQAYKTEPHNTVRITGVMHGPCRVLPMSARLFDVTPCRVGKWHEHPIRRNERSSQGSASRLPPQGAAGR
jgi:hypothetical protein